MKILLKWFCFASDSDMEVVVEPRQARDLAKGLAVMQANNLVGFVEYDLQFWHWANADEFLDRVKFLYPDDYRSLGEQDSLLQQRKLWMSGVRGREIGDVAGSILMSRELI